MSAIANPLTSLPPTEVPLANAPLVRVIGQVGFPLIMSIQSPEFIGPIQEAIRSVYPVLTREMTRGFFVGPGGSLPLGALPMQQDVTWRFADAREDWKWRVSLTSTFLALETVAYSSRADFLARFRAIIEAMADRIDPKIVERLGLRYIDRIERVTAEEVKALVRPEILGLAGTEMAGAVTQSIHETLFSMEHAQLAVRGGLLPAFTTVDPSAIPPIAHPSWILDIDMFNSESRPFEVGELMEETQRFAERIYGFFRWAVTPDFLRRYGGVL